MEPEAAIRQFLLDDAFDAAAAAAPSSATSCSSPATARRQDARRARRPVLYNPAYAPDLCLVYLSHIFMLPEARGTVLTYWLRIAPLELAVEYLHALHQRGLVTLPAPDAPGKYFGMRLNLAAEMEYFSPDDRLSLQRILFYGRGGFDVIDPRHFPYRQPDFRDPELIARTGNRPVPFMLLLRRVGRERQARLPIDEARAVMRLLYDDFAVFCEPQHLASSLDVVLGRLDERRAKGKNDVALLPLPTGARDLKRLKPLFRYDVYRRHYGPGPATDAELNGPIAAAVAANPRWFDEQLAQIARRAREDAALGLREPRQGLRPRRSRCRGSAAARRRPRGAPRDRLRRQARHLARERHKRYGDFVAVEDANFDIRRGEFFSMLGPSGCGKTTMLRMIAGFEEVTSGGAEARRRRRRRRAALPPQRQHRLPELRAVSRTSRCSTTSPSGRASGSSSGPSSSGACARCSTSSASATSRAACRASSRAASASASRSRARW